MDARIRYTKRILREVLLDLLKDRDLSCISVTDLCEGAEINRATFYRYYESPVDLLNHIEAELLENLRERVCKDTAEHGNNEKPGNSVITADAEVVTRCEALERREMKDNLMILLKELKENADIYKPLISRNGDPTFGTRMLRMCIEGTKEAAVADDSLEMDKSKESKDTRYITDISEEQLWMREYYIGGAWAVILSWMEEGMQTEPEKTADFIETLIS